MSVRAVCAAVTLAAVLAAAAPPARCQDERPEWEDKVGAERFGPIAWLEGEWQGYGEFPDRTNYIRVEYSYDVGGMYLVERTTAMFPPAEASTDYEIHQDVTYYYRDSSTGGFAARSFFIEAFVVDSGVEVSEDGSVIVVQSTSIDNAPEGMRSRFTISRTSDDGFTADFEVAMPGADYSLYEEMVMTRTR